MIYLLYTFFLSGFFKSTVLPENLFSLIYNIYVYIGQPIYLILYIIYIYWLAYKASKDFFKAYV